MQTTTVLLRRHPQTFGPGLLARGGAPRELTALNQEVARRVGAMSASHDPRHRADTLEALGRDFLPRLGAQHEALKATRDLHAPGPRDFNLVVGRDWWDVLARGPRLLRTFSEEHAMTEVHQRDPRLLGANDTFAIMLTQDAATRAQALAYAAAVAPNDRAGWGIRLDAQNARTVDRLWGGADRPVFLSRQSVLLLRDYVHPLTGSFNFYRAADGLHAQHPELGLLQLLENVPAQLAHAVRAAWAYPGLRGQGPFHRGLWSGPGMHLVHGATYDIRRPTSAAMSSEDSYLGRCVCGALYDIEIQFHDGLGGQAQGLLVSPFQPASPAPQRGEVLLTDGQFQITDSRTEERRMPGGGSFMATIFRAVKQTENSGARPH